MKIYCILGVLFLTICLGSAQEASPRPPEPSAPTSAKKSTPPPIETTVTSEKFQLDLAKHEGVFLGGVEVSNPRFTLKAEELTMYLSSEGKPERFIAVGGVIIQSNDRHASAHQAEYNLAEKKIILTGKPHVQQQQNHVSGNTIIIYPESDRMDVLGRTSVRFVQ